MRRLLPILFVLIVLFFVTSCQLMVHVENESAHYFRLTSSSKLILNQDITIPANKLSVYLQNGNIIAWSQIDKDQPNCKFELKSLHTTSRVVKPDTFKIIKLLRDTEYVSYNAPIFASRSLSSMSDGGPMTEIYSTSFYLQSYQQPEVLYLTCQYWEDPMDGEHLSLQQIRTALGEIFSIQN